VGEEAGKAGGVTDQAIQRKLNQLVKIANALGAEAQSRYGESGHLFFESGGDFNFMDGDSIRSSERQSHVRLASNVHCSMGCGSW
jgi:hypothetical protein